MLQLIAANRTADAFFAAALFAAAFLALLAYASREPVTGGHTRGKRFGGVPAEIRRHRTSGPRTYPDTISACNRLRRPSTHHAVDDAAPQRHRAANRYEDTQDITNVGLDVILGPRPAAGVA